MSYLTDPGAAGIRRRKQASGLGEAWLDSRSWNAQLVLLRAQLSFFKQPYLHKTNETGHHTHKQTPWDALARGKACSVHTGVEPKHNGTPAHEL